ncbi:hypothetical protein CHS0354_000614 [Potamilus streckersoni]|uniref:Cytochrome P450 n=1 Tax=Potamilus streckersoni TaxID=2493646 RepID=A0AAE0W999_9BIVA|nr:hypothetical protein CHS0354_000614 [Potamilus streckersoni]
MLKPLIGNGLLTSEGSFWLRQRRLSQPAFTKEKINTYSVAIRHVISEIISEWKPRVEQNLPINVTKETYTIALRVVTTTLFLSTIKHQEEKLRLNIYSIMEKIMFRAHRAIPLPFWLPLLKHLSERRAIREVLNYINKIIDERRLMKSTETNDDLLNMLMNVKDIDTGEKMSNEQLRDEIVTLFIAGFETTAVTLAYTLLLLAQHPKIKDTLLDELKLTLKGEQPNMENIQRATYLDAVIKESLRLYPAAWQISRRPMIKENLGNIRIPAYSGIMIPIFALHRNPIYWQNPEKFIPERWIKDGKTIDPEPFTYLPFGAGQRICIGERFAIVEIKFALVLIFNHFNLAPIPVEPIELDTLITLKPQKEISLVFVQK